MPMDEFEYIKKQLDGLGADLTREFTVADIEAYAQVVEDWLWEIVEPYVMDEEFVDPRVTEIPEAWGELRTITKDYIKASIDLAIKNVVCNTVSIDRGLEIIPLPEKLKQG